MISTEQIIFNFSVSNTSKDNYYQVSLINEDLSSGNPKDFNTSLLKCENDGEKIIFKESFEYNFDFSKIQKLKIIFIKKLKIKKNSNLNHNTNKSARESYVSLLLFYHHCKYVKPLNKNNPDQDIFCIEINKKSKKFPTFFDFLFSGVKLLSFIAIDFSHGKNRQSFDISKDIYIKIMKQITNKLDFYSKDFYLYGYGAKLKNIQNSNALYHSVFSLNENDESINSQNLIDNFKNFTNYNPEKKVLLSELIRKITKKICVLYNIRYYNILFILARELISDEDKQNSIDSCIESCYLPFSLIIICIGKNEFKKMNQLYGKKIKESSVGMKKIRNNILSICYTEDYDEDEERMIEGCLREISSQIMEYFKFNMCTPDYIKENIVCKNIENSINKYKSSIYIYESKMSSIYESQKKEQEDEIDEFDILKNESIPNLSKINDNKNLSKLSDINLENDELKKKEKNMIESNTPNPITGKYIIPNSDSIMLHPGRNIYNKNKEEKFTPGQSINENYLDESKINENNSNLNKEYKIILDSVQKEVEGNPYQNEKQYKIPKLTSLAPSINYNPYVQNKNLYILGENEINLYNKDNKEKNINSNKSDKKKIIIDSNSSEFLSTNNSNNNQERGPKGFQLNYSIDTSHINK